MAQPKVDSSFLSGMVRCCQCGSRNVRGFSRYGRKTRRVIAVEYVCECGNRYVVGDAERAVPSYDVDYLRRAGYQIGGRR